jgi:uncharacterized protein (TIGR02145 family)
MLSLGMHKFIISGLFSGIYTLSVKSTGYFYSGKIFCASTSSLNPKITYISGNLKSTAKGNLKSTQSLVPMQYTNGDQLLFKCFSGIYSTVIPLVPTQSQMVSANLVACTDVDNNNYTTVNIGTQVWMAENLKVGVSIDGTQEQTDNGTIEKYCYDNDEANCNVYGGLYQWNEIMQYSTTPGTQGICPIGWHIPTNAELNTLTSFLGGQGVAGGKMKSTGIIGNGTGLWRYPNTGATNEIGFTAVPSGELNSIDSAFHNIGYKGCWWSSSLYSDNYAWYWETYYDLGVVSNYFGPKNQGFSTRCLWDGSLPFTCGSPITINHITGAVAPVNKTVTYGIVTNIPGEPSKCWITNNLGASHQATSVDDETEASAGWYWQFNRKQGYKHTGTVRTPNTTWITAIDEDFDWQAANDPCALELGAGWRVPSGTEWTNVFVSGGWTDWYGPWNSALKLHAAGYLFDTDGSLSHRGSYGYYWSSNQYDASHAWRLYLWSGGSNMDYLNHKAISFSIRCLREN